MGAGQSSYGTVRSEHGAYTASASVGSAIRATTQSLKPLRAQTAPADDLERERRAISLDAQQSLVLVQVALVLVVLSLVLFLILPRDWATGLSFLLLCVGVASGFFLRR
jgi:hypothetical protein